MAKNTDGVSPWPKDENGRLLAPKPDPEKGNGVAKRVKWETAVNKWLSKTFPLPYSDPNRQCMRGSTFMEATCENADEDLIGFSAQDLKPLEDEAPPNTLSTEPPKDVNLEIDGVPMTFLLSEFPDGSRISVHVPDSGTRFTVKIKNGAPHLQGTNGKSAQLPADLQISTTDKRLQVFFDRVANSVIFNKLPPSILPPLRA